MVARTVGGEVLVGGQTAITLDSVDSLHSDTKGAVAFIVIATYIVLFLLLGSVLLPLKAVLVNLLSISASYGALVWIFQEGHLSNVLGFTPGSIEPIDAGADVLPPLRPLDGLRGAAAEPHEGGVRSPRR